MIAAPARLPSPHQGLPSTPWQALLKAAARISSFLGESRLRAVSRLRTFMAAVALALTPTPHRERLPAHRSHRRLAPPRPAHHSGGLSRNPVFIPHPQPPPKTTPRRHPSYPRRACPSLPRTRSGGRDPGRVSTPTTGSTPLPAEKRPVAPQEFFGKNSYRARDSHFPASNPARL